MKLDENIKCLIQLASTSNASVAQDSLYETLEIVEKAQIQFVKLHQVSQLLVHKGVILGKLDKRDEALRAFSAAALLESENVDDNTNSSSLWRKWGNYLSSIFSTNQFIFALSSMTLF
jgi:hypothetical protein